MEEADKKAAEKTKMKKAKWGSLATCVTNIDSKALVRLRNFLEVRLLTQLAIETQLREGRHERETIKRNSNLWSKAKIAKALKRHKNTFNRRCRDIRATKGRKTNFFYVSHHINDEKPVYK